MSDTAYIAEFADNLWNKYMKLKLADELQDDVRFYKAQVVQNPGNGTLVVQKPYEDAVTVSCTNDMKTVAVGKMVTVLVFGTGNAANHIAVSAAGMKDLKITGSDAAADYVVESGASDVGSAKNNGLNTQLFTDNELSRIFWQKWNSGKLEIWGRSAYKSNVSVTTKSGGGYVSTYLTFWGAWPVQFVMDPSVSVYMTDVDSATRADYMIVNGLGNYLNPKQMSPSFRLWSGSSRVFGHPQFAFCATGMWK